MTYEVVRTDKDGKTWLTTVNADGTIDLRGDEVSIRITQVKKKRTKKAK